MLVFLKKLMYEPALFFGVTTAVLASASAIWSNDVLAFAAAAFAVAGGIVVRSLTVTKKWNDEQPTGFVDLEAS